MLIGYQQTTFLVNYHFFITSYNYWLYQKLKYYIIANISLPFIFLYNEGVNLERSFPMKPELIPYKTMPTWTAESLPEPI